MWRDEDPVFRPKPDPHPCLCVQGEEDGGEEGGGGDGPATERAEEVDVDGTNFLAAESVAALDLLGEFL